RGILVSPLANPIMHFGMAEYSDHGHGLWHSRAWGSSITSSSGAHALTRHGQILFPSDFVRFPFTYVSKLDLTIQYGRITFVGTDKRTCSLTKGKVVVKIQPVILASS